MRAVNVYKRTSPTYQADLCEHRALNVVHDRDNSWRGLYCEHCQSMWFMSEIGKALELLELERVNAPD